MTLSSPQVIMMHFGFFLLSIFFHHVPALGSGGVSHSFRGPDITKPWPGGEEPIDGWQAKIDLVPDLLLPVFGDLAAANRVIILSTLSFSPPDALFFSDHAKHAHKGTKQQIMNPIDPSWHICQYYFLDSNTTTISSSPSSSNTELPKNSCAFLSPECKTSLQRMYGGGFASQAAHPQPEDGRRRCWLPGDGSAHDSAVSSSPNTRASSKPPPALSAACQASYRLVIPDILSPAGFDDSVTHPRYFAQRGAGQLLQLKREVVVANGTGWKEPDNNQPAYGVAANGNWVVVTVWGYSDEASLPPDGVEDAPTTSLSCLRANLSPREDMEQDQGVVQQDDDYTGDFWQNGGGGSPGDGGAANGEEPTSKALPPPPLLELEESRWPFFVAVVCVGAALPVLAM